MRLWDRSALLRVCAAGACLVVLWICELGALRRQSLRGNLQSLARASNVFADRLRASGPSFAFDPDYSEFLVAVRDRTPSWAVIALSIPRTNELYTYDAWYVLAPRRLVDAERGERAQFLATYRDSGRDGDAIPQGRLRRLP